MSKEFCTPCRGWEACMFSGYSLNGLLELELFERSYQCPQFPDLLQQAEAKNKYTNIQPKTDNPVAGSEPVMIEKEVYFLPEVAADILESTVQSDIEIIFDDTNNGPIHQTDTEDEFLQEDLFFEIEDPYSEAGIVMLNSKNNLINSGVTKGFQEYINIETYLERTKIPDYLWEPFKYIAEAIDSRNSYINYLSNEERKLLSDEINIILREADVYKNNVDAIRFLRTLNAAIFAWQYNTRGKKQNDIYPFM
jgi:hypothetical protein